MPLKSQAQFDRNNGFTIIPKDETVDNAAPNIWSAVADVARHVGKQDAVEIASKAFGAQIGQDAKDKSKSDSNGLSAATKRMFELLGINMMNDEDLQDVDVEDGGPGSGNFGHKGRPDHVGGSGKGGGKQYRSARAEGLGGQSKTTGGNTGYGGTRRDWANALAGEQGNRADKLVKKFAAPPPPPDSKEAKKYSATESAQKKIMTEGSTAEKAEWLALKSKARLFDMSDPDSKYTKQCLERLSDDDRKAFQHIYDTYGSDPASGQLSQDLITGCVYDGDFVQGVVPAQVRDYYMSLKSKALQGADDGMAMPDEVAYSMGIKERPSPTGFKWGDGLSDESTKKLQTLNETYGDAAKSAGEDITAYIMKNGDFKQREALLQAYEEKVGWSDYGTRQKLREENTDQYDRKVFDLYKSKSIFGSARYTQRKNLYSMMHAKEMGLYSDDSYDQKIYDQVKKTRDIDAVMMGIKHMGGGDRYKDMIDLIKPGQSLRVDLQPSDPSKASVITGIRIDKATDGTLSCAMQMGVGTDFTAATQIDMGKAIGGLRSAVQKLGLKSAGGQFKALAPVYKPRTQPKTTTPKVAAAYKTVGSLANIKDRTQELKKRLFSSVDQQTMAAASQSITKFIQNPKTAFSMRIPAKTLSSILKTNFMSQIQLVDKGMKLASGGFKGPQVRAEASKKMFGTQRKPGNGQQFEKYGYIGMTDFGDDYANSGDPSQYGNVIVHFKKQNMYGRTTCTMGDSLSSALSQSACPSFVGQNGQTTATGVLSYKKKQSIEKMASEQGYKSADKTPVGFMRDTDGYGGYYQAQYHGKLTMQDDVSQICFTKQSQMTRYLSAATKKKLKSIGIKVYVLRHGKPQLVDIG